jgi:hypothetical protein
MTRDQRLDIEDFLKHNMLGWSKECFHKVHQLCVADAATHRTATVQDGIVGLVLVMQIVVWMQFIMKYIKDQYFE